MLCPTKITTLYVNIVMYSIININRTIFLWHSSGRSFLWDLCFLSVWVYGVTKQPASCHSNTSFVYGRCVPQVVEWMVFDGWLGLVAGKLSLRFPQSSKLFRMLWLWCRNNQCCLSRRAGDTKTPWWWWQTCEAFWVDEEAAFKLQSTHCYTICIGLIENQNEVTSVQLFHDRKASTLFQ